MNTACSNPTVPSNSATTLLRRPRYQVENGTEADIIRVDLPGVSKDAVHLHLEDQVLMLRAERKTVVPETWKPLHRELSDADYQLRLRITQRVDDSKMTASLEEGVLTVTLPVRETVKPRTIEVQ